MTTDRDDKPEERRERLKELIRRKALEYGVFTLASGRKSRYYLDVRRVTLDAEGAYLIAAAILDFMQDEGITASSVGGLTLGADPIAGAVAAISHVRGRGVSGFIVRKAAKDHGAGRRIEGGLERGDTVVVVDDVVTTAGSTLEAIRAVESAGCEVAAVVCVVDRREGGAEALKAYRFQPLFAVDELLEDAR